MNILFFGDVVGEPGRRALQKILPDLKKKYAPNAVLVNGENLSHGSGITKKTVLELFAMGVDIITGGNHTLSKPESKGILEEYPDRVLRPLNYPEHYPGKGFTLFETSEGRLLILNVLGSVFMKEKVLHPFHESFRVLAQYPAIPGIVDMHAEATSEKQAMGWALDGKVSAVLGTHTHVPTADERILPQGTAYVTDLGMVGAKEGILGANRASILQRFLTEEKNSFGPEEDGPLWCHGVYIQIDPVSRRALSIKRIDENMIFP